MFLRWKVKRLAVARNQTQDTSQCSATTRQPPAPHNPLYIHRWYWSASVSHLATWGKSSSKHLEKSLKMGSLFMERIFRSTPNGILTAHTWVAAWCETEALQYHLCSIYRQLWGLVVSVLFTWYWYVALAHAATPPCQWHVNSAVCSGDSYKTENADDGKAKSRDTRATNCEAGTRERPANLFILPLPCRCRHVSLGFTYVLFSRRLLHSNPFSHFPT